MSEFRAIQDIDVVLSTQIAPGIRVPHASSAPLLRLHDGQLVIAEFLFVYTGRDIEAAELERPSYWAVAEIASGELIERFDCRQRDFSKEQFGTRYSIDYEPDQVFDDEYVAESFRLLDQVRLGYLNDGAVDAMTYGDYFDRVLAAVAPAYRVFYNELGSPEALAKS